MFCCLHCTAVVLKELLLHWSSHQHVKIILNETQFAHVKFFSKLKLWYQAALLLSLIDGTPCSLMLKKVFSIQGAIIEKNYEQSLQKRALTSHLTLMFLSIWLDNLSWKHLLRKKHSVLENCLEKLCSVAAIRSKELHNEVVCSSSSHFWHSHVQKRPIVLSSEVASQFMRKRIFSSTGLGLTGWSVPRMLLFFFLRTQFFHIMYFAEKRFLISMPSTQPQVKNSAERIRGATTFILQ